MKADSKWNLLVSDLEKVQARIEKLEELVREMENILLLAWYVFTKIKNEGFLPTQKMLDEIKNILNRPEVREIMEKVK